MQIIDPLTGNRVTYNDGDALTWDQCAAIVAAGEIGKLNRTDAELQRYQAWMAFTQRAFPTVEEYIKSVVFTAPSTKVDGDGDATAATATAEKPKLVLRMNDFPYNLADGIEHWVLWSTEGELAAPALTRVVQHWLLAQAAGRSVPSPFHPPLHLIEPLSPASAAVATAIPAPIVLPEWTYWVNPPHRQTIPGIWHAHILVHRASVPAKRLAIDPALYQWDVTTAAAEIAAVKAERAAAAAAAAASESSEATA
ncbi:hypothetical protein H9P43_005930 [Blastocladiella emersonii ATCC 22665]|nr:hypothetical protein H9P43_005930 [Blastocladiella emersonii ATCC 22665]